MKWQPIRNKDYSSKDTYCRGKCPRFNESATLFVHHSGTIECRFDLHPIFRSHIKECSLLKEKNDKNTACMLSCPVFVEYKNSHDY